MRLPSGTYNVDYAKDMAVVRTRAQWVLLVVFLVFLAALPHIPVIGSRYYLGMINTALIWLVAVYGLNILTGYCGQISLGHAAFMGVGAYSSGILIAKFGWPFWASLPTAIVITALVGIIFGLPALRLKGLYLIMTTMAAQFIIMYVVVHIPQLTGGGEGMSVPTATLGGIVIDTAESNYYLIIVSTVLATFLSVNIARSQMGRAFVAIRDNDIAAEVMGIDLTKYKLLAFAIGCAFAGWAGALWANYSQIITQEQFTLWGSLWFLGMLIVGGGGTVLGAILGTIFIRGLFEATTIFAPPLSKMLHFGLVSIGSIGQIIFGLVIILFLVFEPRGLAHRWAIFKSYYRLWPFSH